VSDSPLLPPDRRAGDPTTAALIAVLTIKHGDDASRETLAAMFLTAAWPTVRAQNQ